MKCSLDISNFLEEIVNPSHSVAFFYFFALFIEEGLLISPCSSLDLYIQVGISFPFFLAFHFRSFLRCFSKPLQSLCLLAFLFLQDGFGHCLLHNVMNLHP